MGTRGRYGKYGERKRLERLRDSRAPGATPRRGIAPRQGRSSFLKGINGSPLGVRPARPTDMGYIRDLSKRSFQQYGPYHHILSQWFELGTTITLLACQDKRAVGFAMLGRPLLNHPAPLETEVLAIAVERNSQRKGIGDLLMREVKSAAHHMQVEKILLHTAVENVPACSLFKKHGFVPGALKKGFYPRGQDALMMFKEM
ncbi:MAG: GNAT family N-acetyltransferase [Deltaproteobacteria bacterium]|nr:GNAT family N-acetyltransferase [Deltaproteobacteria bacterium]